VQYQDFSKITAILKSWKTVDTIVNQNLFLADFLQTAILLFILVIVKVFNPSDS